MQRKTLMPHRHGALIDFPPTASARLTSQTCLALAEVAVEGGESLGLAQPLALGHTILSPTTAKGKLATINA